MSKNYLSIHFISLVSGLAQLHKSIEFEFRGNYGPDAAVCYCCSSSFGWFISKEEEPLAQY